MAKEISDQVMVIDGQDATSAMQGALKNINALNPASVASTEAKDVTYKEIFNSQSQPPNVELGR